MKNLALTLTLASITLSALPISADIVIEGAGLPVQRLTQSSQQKSLPLTSHERYFVFGYYCRLDLGEHFINDKKQLKAEGQTEVVSTITAPVKKLRWSRVHLATGINYTPLDLFRSSKTSIGHSRTLLFSVAKGQSDLSKTSSRICLEGNAANTRGRIVLCAEYIPQPLVPSGSLRLQTPSLRNGERARLNWQVHNPNITSK